jgi:hypothetical protein
LLVLLLVPLLQLLRLLLMPLFRLLFCGLVVLFRDLLVFLLLLLLHFLPFFLLLRVLLVQLLLVLLIRIGIAAARSSLMLRWRKVANMAGRGRAPAAAAISRRSIVAAGFAGPYGAIAGKFSGSRGGSDWGSALI